MLEGCHIDVNFKLGYTPFDRGGKMYSRLLHRLPTYLMEFLVPQDQIQFLPLSGAKLFYEH